MKNLLAVAFITLLTLATGCAWISPAAETTSDGIQVHGHWTVTVTNPDGSVDAVHEFENALTDYGKSALAHLITGSDAVNFFDRIYSVVISNATDWHCLESPDPTNGNSVIRGSVSPTSITLDEAIGNPVRVTAICTASDSGTIGTVQMGGSVFQGKTFNVYVETSNFTGNLPSTNDFGATLVSLNPPISVVKNQVIAYNYIISFN